MIVFRKLLSQRWLGQISVNTLIFALACFSLHLSAAFASGRADIALSASPETIFADAKSTTIITATVRDGGGNLAPDGTTVGFETSLGTLDTVTATTKSGEARVTLTSAAYAGTAAVKATSISAGGSATGQAFVNFTTNRDDIFSSGQDRWIHIDSPQQLFYSADDKIIEAYGRNQSVHLQYKSLDIAADSLQFDLQAMTLLATNATLQRAHHTVNATQIRYNLETSLGTAVLKSENGHAGGSVDMVGLGLVTQPQSEDEARDSVQSNLYRFVDISASRVIVSARAISVDPTTSIQFRRATIYSDGKRLLSLPLHVLPVNTTQIFGQQLIGFGTQGFFLNVPYYYNVSPHSIGTIYLRNSAVQGSGADNVFESGGSRPGLALDLQQTYDFGRAGSGALYVDGLTRSEWGAHWNHTQHIDQDTSSYFYVDYPEHRSLFGSSNITRQFHGFNLNLDASGDNDPGVNGNSFSSETVGLNLQLDPREIGQSGINYVAGVSNQIGRNSQHLSDGTHILTPISTRGVDVRFFTAPLHPAAFTTLSDSLTIGQSWSASGRSDPTLFSSIGLNRSSNPSNNFGLSYNIRYDPLYSQPLVSSNQIFGGLQHQFALTYNVLPTQRLLFSTSASYDLPMHDSSLFGLASYRINNDWGLSLSSAFGIYPSQYSNYSYRETQFSVSRRFLGRDIVFTYSTLTKKISFNLGSGIF